MTSIACDWSCWWGRMRAMDWGQIWDAIVFQLKAENPQPVLAAAAVVVTLSIGVWANPASKRRRDGLKTDLDIVKTASEIGIPFVTGPQLESLQSRVERHFTPTTRIGGNIMMFGVALMVGTPIVWVLMQFSESAHDGLDEALVVSTWSAIVLFFLGFLTAASPDLKRAFRNVMSERARSRTQIRGSNSDVPPRRERRPPRRPKWQ